LITKKILGEKVLNNYLLWVLPLSQIGMNLLKISSLKETKFGFALHILELIEASSWD